MSHQHSLAPRPDPSVDEVPQQRDAGSALLADCPPRAGRGVAQRHDLAVVVPALNEALRLPRTLVALTDLVDGTGWDVEVLVVDNGSVDRTAEVVARHGDPRVRVVGCRVPGKGAAVRRGVDEARASYVGFMDADLATPVEYLLPALDLLHGGAGAVIASRTAGGATEVGRTPLRRLASAAFRRSRPSLVSDFVDTQCGFKFFEAEVARRAFSRLRSTGFSFDVELLAHVVADGALVAELPVSWTDVAGSTFSPWRHGLRSFVELDRIRRDLAGDTR